jgi:hypothetical protein
MTFNTVYNILNKEKECSLAQYDLLVPRSSKIFHQDENNVSVLNEMPKFSYARHFTSAKKLNTDNRSIIYLTILPTLALLVGPGL